MTDGPDRTRRRRRRGGRGRQGQGRAPVEQPAPAAKPVAPPARRPMPTWEWLRLPVAIAFALGVIVMRIFVDTEFAPVIYVVALFIIAFGVANIVSRRIAERRRSARER